MVRLWIALAVCTMFAILPARLKAAPSSPLSATAAVVAQQQAAPAPERPGKPRWKGTRLKGHERPVTQTVLTMFALVGVLYTIARSARRAYGD